MKNFTIKDESNDHKYFTIVPNYVLNHSSRCDREVYIQMKRIAGESGTCWSSMPRLSKQCDMTERRLKKSIKYLIEHKWISLVGKKPIKTIGGKQFVNEYKMNDLWSMNNTFYEVGAKKTLPNAKVGAETTSKVGSKTHPKEEPIEEEIISLEEQEQIQIAKDKIRKQFNRKLG